MRYGTKRPGPDSARGGEDEQEHASINKQERGDIHRERERDRDRKREM